MIEIYGVNLSQLPDRRGIWRLLDERYAAAWRERHRSIRDERAARASIAGFLLLQMSGMHGDIEYDERGRPYFLYGNIDFNISHTAQHVFCAIETKTGDPVLPEPPAALGYPFKKVPSSQKKQLFPELCRVGLDAENLDRLLTMRICPLAERWFTGAEEDFFLSDPTDENFLRIWTRKEALVKWTGDGLSAMRTEDTVTAQSRYDIRFYEYRVDDAVLTLCCHSSSPAPPCIRMLTGSEIMMLM